MQHPVANPNFYSLSGDSSPVSPSEEYLTYRRAWHDYPAGYILRDFPMHLDVEATSRCNLRCTFCDKLPLLAPHQLGEMDIALYRRIIDEATENRLWGLKLSYRGEPLLHGHIVEMVDYAVKGNVLDVYFNTNGMLLTPEMSARLIDAGLHRISVSVEGTDPEAFEQSRIGAKFHVILRNMQHLMEMKQRLGVSHPRLRVQTVLFPGMDLEAYRAYWMDKCDEVAAIDFKDELHRDTTLTCDWSCPQLWQRMTIEWDGTVFPCNNDDLRTLSPGNVRNRTVRECWNDARVQETRGLHRAGKSHLVGDCNGCPWRTAQINKLISEDREAR